MIFVLFDLKIFTLYHDLLSLHSKSTIFILFSSIPLHLTIPLHPTPPCCCKAKKCGGCCEFRRKSKEVEWWLSVLCNRSKEMWRWGVSSIQNLLFLF